MMSETKKSHGDEMIDDKFGMVMDLARNSKRQKPEPKVLYVATPYRLVGVKLEILDEICSSYESGSGQFPRPDFELDMVFQEHGLPFCPSVFGSSSYNRIYIVGGDRPGFDGRKLYSFIGFKPEMPSNDIYEIDPSTLRRGDPPKCVLVGKLSAAKSRPIIETLGGRGGGEKKTYAISRESRCVAGVNYYSSPLFELLDVPPSSTPVAVEIDDTVLREQDIRDRSIKYLVGIAGHVVIGSRIYLRLWSNDTPMACFDAARGRHGEWVTNSIDFYTIYNSFESAGINSWDGMSVSVEGFDDAGGVGIGNDFYVLLLSQRLENHGIEYYACIATNLGLLLCSQNITEDIFRASKVPIQLRYACCRFVDYGGGNVYAVAFGVGWDPYHEARAAICVSKFTIRTLSPIDHIISEVSGSGIKEAKFIDISSVKNYTFNPTDDDGWGTDINGAFVL